MSPSAYLACLYAAGAPRDLPVHKLDEWAARFLRVSIRTARRYRCGGAIPGPVAAMLEKVAREAK